ncbi:MAG TPA: BON domain-containing protein, partial [Ktedonobacterales bacterium]
KDTTSTLPAPPLPGHATRWAPEDVREMQRAVTDFAAVWKFRFGSAIHTDDGELGTLTQLAVDPARRGLTHVGVRFGLFGRARLLPTEVIADVSPDIIQITLSRADAEKRGENGSGVVFSEKTQIALNGKRLGRLVQLSVNRETLALRHMVADRGLGGEVLVSAADISQVDARHIVLDVAQPGAQPLTPFRPDAELYTDVREAIESYPRLRIDMDGIEIHAIDGVVWLKGYVSSELNRRLVQDQLINIRGLAELHNELLTDTDLAAAVSAALASDPRTASERIGVYPALGTVRLRGSVRTPAAREAAGQIAAGVPGVKAVENALHIDPAASVLPVLAGVTNAEDRVPGD